jgi:hypothetical protein
MAAMSLSVSISEPGKPEIWTQVEGSTIEG